MSRRPQTQTLLKRYAYQASSWGSDRSARDTLCSAPLPAFAFACEGAAPAHAGPHPEAAAPGPS
eukprot:7934803-Alexandrium_andersonii.AAC.1